MDGILEEGSELMEETEDEATADAALIASAQRVEHYEIAAYGTVRTYAQQLGHEDQASLLQETLDEEGQTDKLLTQLAESSINIEAEATEDAMMTGDGSSRRRTAVRRPMRARRGVARALELLHSARGLEAPARTVTSPCWTGRAGRGIMVSMTQPSTSDRGASYDAPASVAPPPPAEKSSLFDDFMDIFYAPASVFARRENASFWIPLLIISVLLGIIFIANRDLMEPIMNAEMARAMARSGRQLSPEQVEAARKFSSGFVFIGAFLGPPVRILAVGVMLWIVGKFFDAKQLFNAALVVSTYATVPRVIEGIAMRVQGLFVDPSSIDSAYSLSLGLGRFLDPDSQPLLLALAGRVDVFTIWVTVLLVIGLAVTGKISRARAALAGVVVWLLGALPAVAGVLRQ
jgi:hypothetical protein